MNARSTSLTAACNVPATTARRLLERLVDHRTKLSRHSTPLVTRFAIALARDVTFEDWADQTAQSWACLLSVIRQLPSQLRRPRIMQWLTRQADPLWREVLTSAAAAARGHAQRLWNVVPVLDLFQPASTITEGPVNESVDPCEAITHVYESFLAEYNAAQRTRRGVYYTPSELVRFMVSEADRLLRDEFQLEHGLADYSARANADNGAGDHDASPWLQILDPAAGSGAFLVEIVRRVFQMQERGKHLAKPAQLEPVTAQPSWDQFLGRWIRQLRGYEILLPACATAQVNMAARLWTTGFSFRQSLPLCVMPHDTLAGPDDGPRGEGTTDEPNDRPATLLIGNPPFSGISENDGPFIAELLRGRWPQDAKRSSYFHVAGRPLKERKVWLNDDYVKFFRYAQWRIDQSQHGLVVFVSNHGYLDNATFRGLRHSWLQSFPRITVIDLHGNAKRREQTPSGERDENVFGIGQGLAVALLRKPPRPGRLIQRGDLWGRRTDKLARLARKHGSEPPLHLATVDPRPPRFLFSTATVASGLPTGPRLTDVMPTHSTAPITARDHFVVAFSRRELEQRMRDFQDLSISDEQMRERYFRRTRSHRYLAGDTRGWNLTEARARMAAIPDVAHHLKLCTYRPFDHRYWMALAWMIDWPRTEVMRHLDLPGNRLLITRRQMLPDQPCNFFWAADRPVFDGIIRSDNRGSESVFPVYLLSEHGPRANFAPEFVDAIGERTGWSWKADGCGDRRSSFAAPDLAAYLYGLFHLPWYRQAYADQLRSDFPRLLLPSSSHAFETLAAAGEHLLDLHCLSDVQSDATSNALPTVVGDCQSTEIAARFPRYRDGVVWINEDCGWDGIDAATWQWRVGAHQVCRKWLRDRRGRSLDGQQLHDYARIVAAIDTTRRTIQQLADAADSDPRELFVDDRNYSG